MLDPVPSASPIRIVAPVGISIHRNGITANAARIPRMKLSAMFIVATNFPANWSYAGLAKFTMLVITVEHTIAVRIIVVMFYIVRNKTFILVQ